MKIKKILYPLLCLSLILSMFGCERPSPPPETTAKKPSVTEPTTEDPYKGMSDEEKLAAVGIWEMEYNPYFRMIFEEGGGGYMVRSGIYFRQSWKITDNVLETEVQLNPDLKQGMLYDFVMEGNSFYITNPEHKTTSRFFAAGTQPLELPEEGEKDSKLLGVWIPETEGYYAYIFEDDFGTSGKFGARDETRRIAREFVWTVYDLELYMYFVEDEHLRYEYIVSGNKLTLSRAGYPNVVYYRAPE